jgi:hypothetical protein
MGRREEKEREETRERKEEKKEKKEGRGVCDGESKYGGEKYQEGEEK